MRARFAVASLLLGVGSMVAHADILWDNYPADSYDATRHLSAERRTQVGPTLETATWVIDDAHFDESVVVEAIEWVGNRQIRTSPPGFGYDSADYAIFERVVDPNSGEFTFNPILSVHDSDWSLLRDGLGTHEGYTTYEGRVDLAEGLALDPGEYWFGVRLVGNEANFQTGRNFLASRSGAVNPDGIADGGYIYNPGIYGDFEWHDSAGHPDFDDQPVDFAFRVVGVPEPGSLCLLLIGAAAAIWRRSV